MHLRRALRTATRLPRYTISVVDGQFRVTGIDPVDGEKFIIYGVGYDGESIRFVSHMPSTGRTGHSGMRIVDREKVEYRFTLIERELWVRKPFSPRVLPPRGAEPGAAPNGGPAEPLGNSEVRGGPPSVS